MKKIAIFGHKHIYTSDGGIEVVVTELAKRLSKHYEVTVFERAEIDQPKRKYPLRGNPVIKLSPTISDKRVNAVASSFFSSLQTAKGKYDVVFVHAEGPCAFLPIVKKSGTRIVAMVHGLDWQRSKWGSFASDFIKFGERQMVKYADDIIVLSEDMQNYFMQTYGRKTILISNGVSANPDKHTDQIEKLGLVPGEYFLYLGRIVPEKRVDLLVNAYKLANTNKKLVIAGSMSKKEREELGLDNYHDGIITPGFVDGALKNQLITHCGLFVLPSDLEGQSIALLEAMSYGAPCLVSDIPENERTLRHFGMTFKSGNLQSLTEALERAEHEKILAGDAEAAFVAKEHNWDEVAREVEKILMHSETEASA